MCKVYSLSYTCEHKQLFRLSRCQGHFARLTRRSGQELRAVCCAEPSLSFKLVTACGACQKAPFDAELLAEKDAELLRCTALLSSLLDGGNPGCDEVEGVSAAREAMQLARDMFAHESYLLEKRFATQKRFRAYGRPRHRPFRPVRDAASIRASHSSSLPLNGIEWVEDVQPGSPLRHELQPDAIQIFERPKVTNDGWDGWADDYARLEDEIAENEAESGVEHLGTSIHGEDGDDGGGVLSEPGTPGDHEGDNAVDTDNPWLDEDGVALLEEGKWTKVPQLVADEKTPDTTFTDQHNGAWLHCLRIRAWVEVSS